MSRELIIRQLPASEYTLTDVSYAENGAQCENCNREIHYVAVVEEQVTKEQFRIGMDCAETLVDASSFAVHEAQLKLVRRMLGALSGFERDKLQHPGQQTWADKNNITVRCDYNPRYQCVTLTIPTGHRVSGRSFSVLPAEWRKLFGAVAQRLQERGIALPALP